MTDDQRAKLMMYERVKGFLTTHAADFPPLVGTLVTEFGTNNGDIHAAAAAQEAGTDAATAARRAKRNTLTKLVQKAADTGQAIGLFLNDPAVVASFHHEVFASLADEDLVTAADAIKVAATPLAADFIARGAVATFLADLQAARDAFAAAIPQTSTSAATETIVQRVKRQDVIVAQFDAVIENVYDAEDPATAPKLADYDFARKVRRVRSGPMTLTLSATRTGNDVTGNVTLSNPAEDGDVVNLRWREQGSTGALTDGPAVTLTAGATVATATVTVTASGQVEVIAHLVRADGSAKDSDAVVV